MIGQKKKYSSPKITTMNVDADISMVMASPPVGPGPDSAPAATVAPAAAPNSFEENPFGTETN